jgi:hypothetical protein
LITNKRSIKTVSRNAPFAPFCSGFESKPKSNATAKKPAPPAAAVMPMGHSWDSLLSSDDDSFDKLMSSQRTLKTVSGKCSFPYCFEIENEVECDGSGKGSGLKDEAQ